MLSKLINKPLSLLVTFISFAILLTSCDSSNSVKEVVIYTSLDRHLSEPVFKQFEKESGIRVKAVYDTEANKTTGLVNRLIAEKKRPRADIFWNSEISKTLLLKQEGITTPINATLIHSDSPMHDPENHWFAFAARERVVLYNIEQVSETEVPSSLNDFFNTKWKNRSAIANPKYGTTATQFAYWHEKKGASWLLATMGRFAANGVQILPGNAQVKDQVASGTLAFGLVDSDDAAIAIASGAPVKIAHLSEPSEGLVIPNTVVKINGGPNSTNADTFIKYLTLPHVEKLLADGAGALIPLITPFDDNHNQVIEKIKQLDAKHFNVTPEVLKFIDKNHALFFKTTQ